MCSDPNAELAGLLDTDADCGLDITHVIRAAAGPGGGVARAAFEAITAPLLNATDSTWDGNSSF
jgi:microcystin degradation protein MlrC